MLTKLISIKIPTDENTARLEGGGAESKKGKVKVFCIRLNRFVYGLCRWSVEKECVINLNPLGNAVSNALFI